MTGNTCKSKAHSRIGEMSERVRALATESGDLSLIPGTHTIERET